MYVVACDGKSVTQMETSVIDLLSAQVAPEDTEPASIPNETYVKPRLESKCLRIAARKQSSPKIRKVGARDVFLFHFGCSFDVSIHFG